MNSLCGRCQLGLSETTFLGGGGGVDEGGGGGGTRATLHSCEKRAHLLLAPWPLQDLWVLLLNFLGMEKYSDHTLSSLTQGMSVPIHHQLNVSLGPLTLFRWYCFSATRKSGII